MPGIFLLKELKIPSYSLDFNNKLKLFTSNEKLKKPWFRSSPKLKLGETKNEEIDTDFYNELNKLGYKVACDTRVRLGKYDIATDTIW